MDYTTELHKIISFYFDCNKAKLVALTGILIGIIKSATCNLTKVAANMPGNTKFDSKYRRIQRFFSKMILEQKDLANFILKQIDLKSNLILILDRTNWKIGKTEINFLVLSVAWKNISIPIFWTNLNRAGNSNTIERMKIISNLIQLIGINRIQVLLGDREFVSEDWIHWLDTFNINFVLRIKSNFKIYNNKKQRKVIKSFKTLSRESTRIICCTLWNLKLKVVGYKDSKGNLLLLATNLEQFENAIELYKIRWQIESMFLCLKSNGFNLEATNLTNPEKLETLFGLLAILTCWNCKIGHWVNKIKPIKIKKHNRPSKTLFTYGMQIISLIINNLSQYKADFKQIIKIFKKPKLDFNYSNFCLKCV